MVILPQMKKCPMCSSLKVKTVDEDLGFIKCQNCGFDELKDFSDFPAGRKSQREKTKFTPYKTGGPKRSN